MRLEWVSPSRVLGVCFAKTSLPDLKSGYLLQHVGMPWKGVGIVGQAIQLPR